MFKKIRDPFSAMTHLAAAVISLAFTVFFINMALSRGSHVYVVAFAIFGLALILLYTASTVYHMLPVPEKVIAILRRVDHMMIFVLIAGTYTPICLLPLRGPWGWGLLIAIWGLAFSGIILKALWINAPRWLSTAIYLFMGWLVLAAFFPLIRAIPLAGVIMLISGGAVYSVGAIFYALKWPKFKIKWFGFHELFHLLVMGGSGFHIFFMIRYILRIA
ncbi:MAG: hemolysin III family protein [Defluviitaleaceae bacterium]|nr:hemolysin III family protein [Defluviitaleaceae bacterium]